MGSRHFQMEIKAARPILNERDYQEVKQLIEREMKHAHSDQVWARLEALMQEVADYEARFVRGEEEDPAGWVQYAYSSALEEFDGPRRRWSDTDD